MEFFAEFWDQQLTPSSVLLCGILVFFVVLIFYAAKLEREVSRRVAEWETRRLDRERNEIERALRSEFEVRLQQSQLEQQFEFRHWKADYAGKIRQDAINRSRATIVGRVAENIAPFMPDFPFNPKDARFLGSPVDFVIFDGLDEGAVREVVFLEMKTETSRLSTRQKDIRDAIIEGRVSWQELRWSQDGAQAALPDQLFDDIG